MKSRFVLSISLTIIVLLGLYILRKNIIHFLQTFSSRKTVEIVLKEKGGFVDEKYRNLFNSKGIEYPPANLILVAYKAESTLELWTKSINGSTLIHSYKIQKLSGKPGPKLQRGDGQVPEGIYKIEGLNPNSRFHLSLKLNYPNDFDISKAELDNRTNLGNDIFIHGNAVSIGCLAMGDETAEDLFILAARAGKENVLVIISPNRKVETISNLQYPVWISDLYREIRSSLKANGINLSYKIP